MVLRGLGSTLRSWPTLARSCPLELSNWIARWLGPRLLHVPQPSNISYSRATAMGGFTFSQWEASGDACMRDQGSLKVWARPCNCAPNSVRRRAFEIDKAGLPLRGCVAYPVL